MYLILLAEIGKKKGGNKSISKNAKVGDMQH